MEVEVNMAGKSASKDARHLRVLRYSLVPLGWAIWLLLALSVISFHPSDPTLLSNSPTGYYAPGTPAHNWCGPVGASIAFVLANNIGPGSWVLIIMLAAFLIVWTSGGNLTQLVFRLLGGAVLIAAISGMANLMDIGRDLPAGPGGLLGVAIGHFLKARFYGIGSALILVLVFIVGMLLAADEIVLVILAMLRHSWNKMPTDKVADAAGNAASAAATGMWDGLAGLLSRIFLGKTANNKKDPLGRKAALLKMAPRPATSAASAASTVKTPAPEVAAPPAPVPAPEPVVVRRPKPTTVEMMLPFKSPPPPQKQDLGNYRLPELDLLEEAEPSNNEGQEEKVRLKARILEECLNNFGVEGKVVAIDTGPVVTLYELELSPGVKSSQVSALSKDIARALMSPPVRTIDNIPGKSTMGIEVPNMDKERVRLKELMQLGHQTIDHMALPMCLGKDASGNPLIEDLTTMPHLLIAGTTGSGKSVCINSIVMTLLLTQRPDHVKLIMIDPKMVEMQDYKQIPHLMSPIIDDMVKAESVLDWATQKMDERYETLAEAGVRNIRQFNKLTREQILEKFQPSSTQEEARIPFHMPYIIIVIDELADLMMTSKETEAHIVRIAQKARAVGIHLILATQRPEAQVVTGLIKSNMPGRICFQVRSRLDSRIMLDQSGGEILLGQGDLLMLRPTGGTLIRGQGTYVDDGEIKRVCGFLNQIAQPEFHPELMQLGTPSGFSEVEKDPLFDEAVKTILETRRGSVSLLQRRLTIGYSRASRLIDQMRAAGIVGAYKGSQASEVLMTLDEWESLRASQPDPDAGEEEESVPEVQSQSQDA
jgi:DNA segregation ATPase FtsK/SpoIIIE, S-DNA-T family